MLKSNPDRPSPPQYVLVKRIESDFGAEIETKFNISWTRTNVLGVDQSYRIHFDTHSAETTQLHYITELKTFASHCGEFLVFITAVNGAGESEPSNNVTIPSLPDIEPVTASLTHQVWKSSGEIMVNVSFEVIYNFVY